MHCTQCGAQNDAEAKFCAQCGATLTAGTHAAKPAAAPHAKASHAPSPPHTKSAIGGPVMPTLAFGKIQDLRTARGAALVGFVAALVGVVLSLYGARALGPILYCAAVLYAVIAFGIWKMSRTAAVVGLVIALLNLFAVIPHVKADSPGPMVWTMVFLCFAYWNAVRGTLAYHRLSAAPAAA